MYYFDPSTSAEYCGQRVCMSVYLFACLFFLSVRSRMSQRSHVHISPNFLYMLPMTVARSSSNGYEICYVLSVLRITSWFHMMEGTSQNQNNAYASSISPDGGTNRMSYNVVWSKSLGGGTGDEVCRRRLHLVFVCNSPFFKHEVHMTEWSHICR